MNTELNKRIKQFNKSLFAKESTLNGLWWIKALDRWFKENREECKKENIRRIVRYVRCARKTIGNNFFKQGI